MTLGYTQYSAVLISRYAHYIAGRNGQSLRRDKTHLLTHDDVCRVCVCYTEDDKSESDTPPSASTSNDMCNVYRYIE